MTFTTIFLLITFSLLFTKCVKIHVRSIDYMISIVIIESCYSVLYILNCATFHYVYLYVLLVFSKKKNDFVLVCQFHHSWNLHCMHVDYLILHHSQLFQFLLSLRSTDYTFYAFILLLCYNAFVKLAIIWSSKIEY